MPLRSSKMRQASQKELETKLRKQRYYQRNIVEAREKARANARRLKNIPMTTEESNEKKQRHRKAQARYRAENHHKLQVASWKYRQNKKAAASQRRADEEYHAFMASYEDEEGENEGLA